MVSGPIDLCLSNLLKNSLTWSLLLRVSFSCPRLPSLSFFLCCLLLLSVNGVWVLITFLSFPWVSLDWTLPSGILWVCHKMRPPFFFFFFCIVHWEFLPSVPRKHLLAYRACNSPCSFYDRQLGHSGLKAFSAHLMSDKSANLLSVTHTPMSPEWEGSRGLETYFI